MEGSSSASTSSSNSSKYEDRSSLRIPSPAKDHSSGTTTKRKQKKFSQKNLFDAISKGDLKNVELCIENGVKINTKDGIGRSPLYMAAKHGRVEIVKFLVQNGADIHAKSNSGRSVLYIAAFSGSVKIVKFLHQNGADINTKHNKGVGVHCTVQLIMDILKL